LCLAIVRGTIKAGPIGAGFFLGAIVKKLVGEKTGRTWCVPALADVMAGIESGDSVGYCLACGAENYGVEPDARRYPCEECEELKVYGAEELLLLGMVHD
jgi:hypothetical protein